MDIDGVLNGFDFSEYIKYNLWKLVPFKSIKNFIREKLSHFAEIDKKRVKRLAKICKKTGAKIVISSSWRSGLLTNDNERKTEYDHTKLFWKWIDYYNIEVIGKTPRLRTSHDRQDEIVAWLSANQYKYNIEKFVVLDDENADLQLFVNSNLVKTSYKGYYRAICNEMRWVGLTNKYVKQAIGILNGE